MKGPVVYGNVLFATVVWDWVAAVKASAFVDRFDFGVVDRHKICGWSFRTIGNFLGCFGHDATPPDMARMVMRPKSFYNRPLPVVTLWRRAFRFR